MNDNYNIEDEKANKKRFDFIFSNGKKERLCVPTVDMYYKIYYAVNTDEKIEGLCDWLTSSNENARLYITPADIVKAEILLTDWLNKLRQLPHYKPPYCMIVETADGDQVPFKTVFHELKIVSDYTNTNFIKLRELDLLTFWKFYKDAIIYNLSRSEKGRDYLRQAYNMTQTKPDREAIKRFLSLQDNNNSTSSQERQGN